MLQMLRVVCYPQRIVPEASGILLSYGFPVDLAFIPVSLNCVHMLEQSLKLLALKQSDYYFLT